VECDPGNYWRKILKFPLSGRSKKPRRDGLTIVIDKGMGLSKMRDMLQTASEYIDMIKLGFGTPALYKPEILREKIHLAVSHGVDIFPGGTFLEVAIMQGKMEYFIHAARDTGFTAIEVSDGAIDLGDRLRARAVEMAVALGLKVFTEVGKKEPGNVLCFKDLIRLAKRDLNNGAYRVIVEGRDPGKDVGLYDERGRLIEKEAKELLSSLGDPFLLIWEAPRKEQQQDLILHFGINVNIGNVSPWEVIALEALRVGLRSDTLRTVFEGDPG